MKRALLEVRGLRVSFRQYQKGFRQTELCAIRDLSLSVCAGEVVAVIGASGSGKSLLAHAILGILPYNARIGGEIAYDGEVLTQKRMQQLRGKEIALVPQSTSYLDPLMKVGTQIQQGKKDGETRRRASEMLARFGLADRTKKLYPFELSGGMTRRVLISTATIEQPHLVIADEPTPGLQTSLARRVLVHFRELADADHGVLLITHDLELALEVADRIVVFYAGMTVEEARTEDFARQDTLRHPYTRALWRAMPRNGFEATEGAQPYVTEQREGCPYAPRCEKRQEDCAGEIPYLECCGGWVRCKHVEGGEA